MRHEHRRIFDRHAWDWFIALVCAGCLPLGIPIGLSIGAPLAAAPVDFDQHVAPLLVRHCLDCHNRSERKGGLDLSRQAGMVAGGETGIVVTPGDPDNSLLWEYVATDHMPPDEPLGDAEKRLLREWIAAGAAWGTDPIDPFRITTDHRAGYDWWSLQPLPDHPPSVALPRAVDAPNGVSTSANPIDAFIAQRLGEAGLQRSPPADRRTLMRRLSFDLLGLPPAPDEVARFVADDDPLAYERLVDRLLASPRYGERWARHWLDVVRFGESQGFERDKLRTHAWPYRDWVIDALNQDLPYDQFARLQLAGDVLPNAKPHHLLATGMLVAGPYDEVGQNQQSAAMRAVVRQDELEDIVGTVGQTFLGLTVNCARCHDHKFDPVSQTEYYALTAALGGVRHGQRPAPGGAAKAQREFAITALNARIGLLRERLGKLPADASDAEREQLTFEGEQLESQRERYQEDHVYAVAPRQPATTRVLMRGNPAAPGEVVAADGVESVRGVDADFGLDPDAPEDERRIALANWLTDRRNPLFARVIVNRLWHYHFGVGLVDTPNDFGFNGGRPSHPELLDWLAVELIRREWSLKSIHRLIVTSAVYCQSARPDDEALSIDADNRLLWRKSPRRLEAEVLRDTLLVLAGQLNGRMFGPGYHDFRTFNFNSQFYEMLDPPGPTFARRSIYRTWVRSGRNSLLDAFDCPDPSATAPSRAVTTTPLQALALLNHSFVLRMADRFAERAAAEAGEDVSDQVAFVYREAFSRAPAVDEQSAAVAFVDQHGLAAFCRVVFNSNELLLDY